MFEKNLTLNSQPRIKGVTPPVSPLRSVLVDNPDSDVCLLRQEEENPLKGYKASDFDLSSMLRDGIDLKEVDQIMFRPNRFQQKQIVENLTNNIDEQIKTAADAAQLDAIMNEIKNDSQTVHTTEPLTTE